MIKAFLVDDEPLARDELAYLLKRTKQVEITGEAESIESALEQLLFVEADVIFLDIQLADESGLDLANKILQLKHRPEIVFATAYDEYALKAFELQAIDYLLKPFDESRVQLTINKLSHLFSSRGAVIAHKGQRKEENDRIAITVEERIVIIKVSEILYIGTVEGKTVVVTDKNKYQVSEPLVNFERRLSSHDIIRVHRAYLINVNAIVEIEPWFHSTYNLIMQDGEKVPVSRTYTKDLKQLLDF
ncbi:two-component response regulator [Bacillus sp. SA1-12]|uniref:LytR/AlgR family response regulator transcription factor n=1 Tax=Bacillus sp. SA1-12 TaxID=1455638 RepID=UPI0006270208|nr:LytTR family transcriptional regulator DNA-binding domain-containing protein [Bacillus sp. SA1-12]KKI89909.1 two-component response regulator [Bacillus sp. SA1-12]